MKKEVLFYDGDCGGCNRFVQFVIRHDRRSRFRFAPLGGSTFHQMLPSGSPTESDSMVLATAEGGVLVKSKAVIGVLARLPAPYPRVAKALYRCPAGFGDVAYDVFARFRHGVFGKRPLDCPVPAGQDVTKLFLD